MTKKPLFFIDFYENSQKTSFCVFVINYGKRSEKSIKYAFMGFSSPKTETLQ